MSVIRPLMRRLAALNPFGNPSPEHEPPEVILGKRFEEANRQLSDFHTPETLGASPYEIHCGGCGDTFSTYWGWFNHLSEEHEFDHLPHAREFATVLKPVDFEASDEEVSRSVESVEADGKPSPAFGNDDDSSKHGLYASELFDDVDGGNDEQ